MSEMAKRVSVDAAALEDFIKSARSDRDSLISEFCVGEAEEESQLADFERGVSRLDATDLPATCEQRKG